jgi:phospholipid transport system transporter-binding protein
VNGNGLSVRADGTVDVSGSLTFDTVPNFLAQGTGWLDGGKGTIILDMKAVSKTDSAGLALMLEWLQQARKTECTIHFVNIPERVQVLIRVNGLTQAFSVSE